MIGWFTVLDVISQVKAASSRRLDGRCSDWLAAFLISAAVVFFGIVMVHGFWSMSK